MFPASTQMFSENRFFAICLLTNYTAQAQESVLKSGARSKVFLISGR